MGTWEASLIPQWQRRFHSKNLQSLMNRDKHLWMRSNITDLKTMWFLHYRGTAFCTDEELVITQVVVIASLLRLDCVLLLMLSAYHTTALNDTRVWSGDCSTYITLYVSWNMDMEALPRAKGLWRCSEVLTQDSRDSHSQGERRYPNQVRHEK